MDFNALTNNLRIPSLLEALSIKQISKNDKVIIFRRRHNSIDFILNLYNAIYSKFQYTFI
jgi:hypothetical protein